MKEAGLYPWEFHGSEQGSWAQTVKTKAVIKRKIEKLEVSP